MSHTAFFYGTLMAPPVLHRVIWGTSTNVPAVQKAQLNVGPAVLHKFQRRKVKNADYPAITPANSTTSVRGTLVSGLTDGDIWRLDIFEGSEYARRKVKVRMLEHQEDGGRSGGEQEGIGNVTQREEDNVEGEEVEAEAYVWIAGSHRLEPGEWDFAEFVRDKMSRWVGREAAETDEGFQGRQSIIDVDDAVAALQDPTGGRGTDGDITKLLDEEGKGKEESLGSAA